MNQIAPLRELATTFARCAISCRDGVLARYVAHPADTENEDVSAFYVISLVDRLGRLIYHTLMHWDSEDFPEAAVLARSVIESSLLLQAVCHDWPDGPFAMEYHNAAKKRVLKNLDEIERRGLPAELVSDSALRRTKEKAKQLNQMLVGTKVKAPSSWMELARKHRQSGCYVFLYTTLSSLTHPIAMTYHTTWSESKVRTPFETAKLSAVVRALHLTINPAATDAFHSVCERFGLADTWAEFSPTLHASVAERLWRLRSLAELD